MSKNWVLVVGGGVLQVPVMRAARDLGQRILLTDRNPDCICADLADTFIPLDTFDDEGHVELGQEWQKHLAAVFTAGADPIVTVARVAQALGLPGVPLRVAQKCANKIKTRFALQTAGVPQPDWQGAVTWGEVRQATNDIEADAFIVKATGSSGSRGHTRGTRQDFQTASYAREAFGLADEWSLDAVLVEELLTGTELSVETLWYNGSMIPLNAVERPFLEGTTIELGHYNPAVLPPEEYKQVWFLMEQAGAAIEMNQTDGGHILKGDLILTDDGPQVLELTTRLSGGFDSGWTSPLAHGVDYTRGALRLALGQPLERAMPDFVPRWYRSAVCLAVLGPEEGGIIEEIQGIEEAEKYGAHHQGAVICRYEAGDELPSLMDCTRRVAFCIASERLQTFARVTAEAMAESIRVVMR